MLAVIDIGSNTIRLVIYSNDGESPESMLNKKYAVGLAGYVDKSNHIRPEGVEILLNVLSDIRRILDYIKPELVLPFGTAALRNSANGGEIVSLIEKQCGLKVRILTGEEEAVFDYYGASEDGLGENGILADVGGGSTEITFFEKDKIVFADSFPLGSLNLYKTYVGGLIPSPDEMRKIKKSVTGYLKNFSFPYEDIPDMPVYCVGGTARAALKLIREYDPDKKKSREYDRGQLKDILSYVRDKPNVLLQSILRTSPDRVHTVVPGMLVFQAIAKYYNAKRLITSRFGVREGYLAYCLKEGHTDE